MFQFHQAAPNRQAILTVSEATSSADLTGVANLEAAPEVPQRKSTQYSLEITSAKVFPSMYLLKGSGLRKATVMTYSNGKSHFCRPFQWRDTGASMVA